MRMDDYFRATSGCVNNYCDLCDDDDCSSDCERYALMAAATSEDGNSTYNGCSATTSSEGLRYFYGPQCTDEGDVTMGYYFDKQCQLNATRRGSIYSPESFVSFDVLSFVHSVSLNEISRMILVCRDSFMLIDHFKHQRSVMTAAISEFVRTFTTHHTLAQVAMGPCSRLVTT